MLKLTAKHTYLGLMLGGIGLIGVACVAGSRAWADAGIVVGFGGIAVLAGHTVIGLLPPKDRAENGDTMGKIPNHAQTDVVEER